MGRITLAIALAYLLLFKALLLPFPGPSAQAGLGPFGSWVLCSHDGSGAVSPEDKGGDPASHHDTCCDEGCLMRIGGLAPLLLVATLLIFSRISSRAPPVRAPARAASGLPWRIASRPHAPRAPPSLCFV